MLNKTRLSSYLFVTVMLSACGSAPSNVEPPATLKSFEKKFDTKVAWSRNLGSMEVSGGRMQLAGNNGSIVTADSSGRVVAFDAVKGQLLWQAELNKPVSTGVASDGSLVALATRNGEVVAVSATDGKSLWSVNILGEVLGIPTIGNGKVIVQTVDGRVLALSLKDGTTIWTYEKTVPSLSLRGNSGAVYQQGLVVAGFASGHIVGLDARNGREIWERVVSYPSGRSDVERLVDVDAPPVIAGVFLFAVSYQGKMVAIDLRNGQMAWSRPVSSYLPIAVDSRNVYVVNDRGVVLALNQSTGANVWIQNDLQGRVTTGPVYSSGAIVIGDSEGYIHVLNAADGKIGGRRGLDSSRVLGHVVAGKRVYTNTEQGKILAYEIRSL